MKITSKIYLNSLLPVVLWIIGFAVVVLNVSNELMTFSDYGFQDQERQNIVYSLHNELGYSKGIHAFKNYVLRGDEKYGQSAEKSFNSAIQILNLYEEKYLRNESERQSIQDIRSTLQEYLEKIPIVKSMVAQKISPREIDKAVVVDDAKAAMALKEFQDIYQHRIMLIHDLQSNVLKWIIGIFLVSSFISLLLGKHLSRSIVKSFNALLEVSECMDLSGVDKIKKDIEEIKEPEIQNIAKKLYKTNLNLNKNIMKLKKSNEDLEHFSFIAAHDLQEPIKRVSNFADMLSLDLELDEESEVNGYIGIIKSSALKMSGLVKALLDYSRFASQAVELEKVDLQKIVDEAVGGLKSSIEEASGEVKVLDLPIVYGNGQLLTVVFDNLISNALKYRKPEEPLKIKIYSEKSEKGHWKVSIEDNGIGFDMRNARKILTPFGRAHQNSGVEGHGIGLSTCNRILASHSSEIEVYSEVNVGSKFSFILSSADIQV